MPSFNEDALVLAKAVVDNHSPYHDGGDHIDITGFECIYCQSGYFEEDSDIKHDLKCPVLIAKDLLTTHLRVSTNKQGE